MSVEFCRNSGTVLSAVPQMSLHRVYSIKLRAVTTPPRSWGISQRSVRPRDLISSTIVRRARPNWATLQEEFYPPISELGNSRPLSLKSACTSASKITRCYQYVSGLVLFVKKYKNNKFTILSHLK